MLDTFTRAARSAGAYLLEKQPSAQMQRMHASGDLLLDADTEAQEMILSALARDLPGVPVIAEELPMPDALPSTFITVDPLDGTIPYSRGCAEWGVNIGFVESGKPLCGVVYLPASDQLLSVHADEVCAINGATVAPVVPEASERFVLGLDLHYATDPQFVSEILAGLTPQLRLTRSLGSTAALTVDFAAGRTDAHINHRGGGIWDIVTLGAVGTALGCEILDFSGNPRRWDGHSTEIVVARTQEMARRILAVTGS